MMTDVVFWCLIVPFLSGDHFSVNLVRKIFLFYFNEFLFFNNIILWQSTLENNF